MKMAGERGFLDGPDDQEPSVFLQWKGTDVCFDFYCKCGAHCHFDGYFAYVVQCPHCLQAWEMPCKLFPREAPDADVHEAKVMEPDEDFADEMLGEDGITRFRACPKTKCAKYP
jgi:hypothetical protein